MDARQLLLGNALRREPLDPPRMGFREPSAPI